MDREDPVQLGRELNAVLERLFHYLCGNNTLNYAPLARTRDDGLWMKYTR